MSRPEDRRSGAGSRGSGSGSRSGASRPPGRTQPSGARTRPETRRSATPGVVRQPVGRPERTGSVREGVERRLPPFSTQRYIVIWILVLIPLVFVLLVLLQFNRGGGATPGASGPVSCGGDKCIVIETAKGRIVAKLHTEAEAKVSKTIENFQKKAASGYFNNLTFHRVEDWVIQGGDPSGDGTGGGNMPSEYNDLPFNPGALGVARGGDPAINNDSQFFVVKTDANFLNGQYTNWGQVTEGMEVVNQIAIGDKINSVRVESK